ncbi:MAG: hypothetical protein ABUS47_06595 [Steroidobacter sp.]
MNNNIVVGAFGKHRTKNEIADVIRHTFEVLCHPMTDEKLSAIVDATAMLIMNFTENHPTVSEKVQLPHVPLSSDTHISDSDYKNICAMIETHTTAVARIYATAVTVHAAQCVIRSMPGVINLAMQDSCK